MFGCQFVIRQPQALYRLISQKLINSQLSRLDSEVCSKITVLRQGVRYNSGQMMVDDWYVNMGFLLSIVPNIRPSAGSARR